jgi:hypothetical protein
MRSFPRQLSDQTSTHIALMNSVRFRMASGPKPYRYLRAYVVVLVVIALLTRRIVVTRVEVGRVVATATKRTRTNVDMHDASAPGQMLIEVITNWICIALRPRAGASCSMACEGCIVHRYEL